MHFNRCINGSYDYESPIRFTAQHMQEQIPASASCICSISQFDNKQFLFT